MLTYAIGDIHGHADLLRAAHARIEADRLLVGDDTAPIVHLGDLTDRGPDSAEVIAYLVAGPVGPAPWITVKGNHDFLFSLFLTDPYAKDPGLRSDLDWLDHRLGGVETLASYGVTDLTNRDLRDVQAEALTRVPVAHRAFLEGLPLTYRRDQAFFVHAGIRPGVPLDQQEPTDLMWIRKPFHDDERNHGPLIVHGHTVIPAAHNYANRVNIDSGAAYGGPVTAVAIEGRRVWEVTDTGRVELLPLPVVPD